MKGDSRLINVRLKSSNKVSRIPRWEADALVSAGKAAYISNSIYKNANGAKLTPAQKRDLNHKHKK